MHCFSSLKTALFRVRDYNPREILLIQASLAVLLYVHNRSYLIRQAIHFSWRANRTTYFGVTRLLSGTGRSVAYPMNMTDAAFVGLRPQDGFYYVIVVHDDTEERLASRGGGC
jgi:hypothetical protein